MALSDARGPVGIEPAPCAPRARDEIDAIGPFEVFANAKAMGAELDVALTTENAVSQVTGANGASIVAHRGWGAERADLLIVPGGGWGSRAPEGTWAEVQKGTLTALLTEAYGAGTAIAGVCTGAMVVASAGLLDGRPAVTHRSALEHLQAKGARPMAEARVVDDGDVITCGGVTAALDLALWIVQRDFGAEIADDVATEIEYDRRGPVWTRGGLREISSVAA